MPIITLLTDYGITDSYVAEVKGAILKINADVTIIDISHDVGNYNVSSGAFHLARSVPYFPDCTIHIGVVDPGVGSSRKAIIIKSRNAWFVGPDNGLLAPAAERLGVEQVWEITNKDILPHKVSDVFDGRDVFGPTGALLSRGVSPDKIGTKINDYIRLRTYEAHIEGGLAEASVIHVDGFGNTVTNITYDDLDRMNIKPGDNLKLTVGDSIYLLPYARRFSAVPKKEPLLLVAGGGYLEISVNQGNASEMLNLSEGKTIKVEKVT